MQNLYQATELLIIKDTWNRLGVQHPKCYEYKSYDKDDSPRNDHLTPKFWLGVVFVVLWLTF